MVRCQVFIMDFGPTLKVKFWKMDIVSRRQFWKRKLYVVANFEKEEFYALRQFWKTKIICRHSIFKNEDCLSLLILKNCDCLSSQIRKNWDCLLSPILKNGNCLPSEKNGDCLPSANFKKIGIVYSSPILKIRNYLFVSNSKNRELYVFLILRNWDFFLSNCEKMGKTEIFWKTGIFYPILKNRNYM